MTCVTCASIRLFALDLTVRSCAGGKAAGVETCFQFGTSSLVHNTLYKGFCRLLARRLFYALERFGSIALLLLDSLTDGRFEETTGIFGRYATMFTSFELLELVELASSRDVVNH